MNSKKRNNPRKSSYTSSSSFENVIVVISLILCCFTVVIVCAAKYSSYDSLIQTFQTHDMYTTLHNRIDVIKANLDGMKTKYQLYIILTH